MKKNLVIIAGSYPYGQRESFLEAELHVVSSFFSKIYIIVPEHHTVDKTGSRFSLPTNAEVVLIDNKLSVFAKAVSVFSLFTPRILHHLRQIRVKYRLAFSLSIFKILFAYEAKERVFRKLLLKELSQRGIELNGLCLYTYWLTEYTCAIARIKESHPEVKTITRAHGWDVYFERHHPPYLPLREYILSHMDRIAVISGHGRNY
ncbi:MAG TPA: hypothetical protein VNJ07_10160, partial [Chitinophagales bacterium]|nr:hypothetical protein [Chitinophagales bacterium]